ncbi:hypothetical protein [Nitrospirillum iridis]|uniref:Bacteriophage tail tape measure N-terminal domain-containing protein n=1 Tax=Nitrospirillum iridis TaxID=765888 RepID=A0A7X0EGY7_9PROT|nr:hypothetical protein [Nitrospirillum iridis]MBB6254099.1 hypothetical protein [Nitrospirillum iridis]
MADQSWTVLTTLTVDDKLTAALQRAAAAAQQAQAAIAGMMNGVSGLGTAENQTATSTSNLAERMRELEQAVLLQTTASQNNSAALRTLADGLGQHQTATEGARRATQEAVKTMEGLSLATVGAKRELLVLVHEMMSGNFSRMPGSMLVLTERMGGLSGATTGAAVGMAALGIGAYELIDHVAELDRQVKGLSGDMAALGHGAQNTPAQIGKWIDEIREKYKLTAEEAGALGRAFLGLTASAEDKGMLERYTVTLAHMSPALGGVEKFSNQVAAAWLGGADAVEKLGLRLQGLSVSDLEALGVARQQHDVTAARNVLLKVMAERAEAAAAAIDKANSALATDAKAKRPGKDDWGVTASADYTRAQDQLKSAMATEGPDQNAVEAYQRDQFGPATLARELREQATAWQGGRAELLAAEVKAWSDMVATGKLGAEAMQEAQSHLNQAQAALRKQNSSDAVTNARDQLVSQAAVTDQGHAVRLQAQINADRALLASDKLTVEDRKAVQRDLDQALAQARQQDSADAITASRDQLARQAALGAQTRTQQLEAQIAADTALLNSGRLTADARLTIERELNQAKAQLQGEARAQQQAIAKDDAATSLELSRIKFQAEKDRLDEEVRLGNITAAQKYAALRDLAQKEAALNEFILNGERAGLQDQPKEFEAVGNRIIALKEQLNADLAKLSRDQTKDELAEFDKRLAGYRRVNSEIGSVASSLVSNILRQQQSMSQILLSLGDRVLSHTMGSLAEEGAKWVEKEALKTAASRAGSAVRMTADAAENSTMLGRIAAQVISWVTGETQKTGAAAAGAAARATIEEADQVARAATGYATALGEIAQLAPVAAAATFASISAIPVVGPGMAPAAAAEAQATVMGMMAAVPFFSAAGGWGQVPADGVVGELHKDEMVLPASIATPLRSAIAAIPTFSLPKAQPFPAFGLPDYSGMRAQAMGAVTNNNVRNSTSHTTNNHISVSVQTGESPSEWLRNGGVDEIHRQVVNKMRNFGFKLK